LSSHRNPGVLGHRTKRGTKFRRRCGHPSGGDDHRAREGKDNRHDCDDRGTRRCVAHCCTPQELSPQIPCPRMLPWSFQDRNIVLVQWIHEAAVSECRTRRVDSSDSLGSHARASCPRFIFWPLSRIRPEVVALGLPHRTAFPSPTQAPLSPSLGPALQAITDTPSWRWLGLIKAWPKCRSGAGNSCKRNEPEWSGTRTSETRVRRFGGPYLITPTNPNRDR